MISGLSTAEPSANNSVPLSEPTPASTSTAMADNGAILSGLQNTLAVKYEDIVSATGGFNASNILGKGGYGVVYKGFLIKINYKKIILKVSGNIQKWP